MATSTDQSTLYAQRGRNARVGAFGANGKQPQTAVTVNAALGSSGASYTQAADQAIRDLVNQIRAALVANGLLA